MTRTGRNDLCPCGSGKKYKNCCLNKDRIAHLRDTSWIRDEQATVQKLLAFAQRPAFHSQMVVASNLFWNGNYGAAGLEAIERDEALRFADWYVFDYRMEGLGKRAVDLFAEEMGPTLLPEERERVRIWQDSYLSLYMIAGSSDSGLLPVLDLLQERGSSVSGGELGRPVMYRFCTGWEIRFKLWIMDRTLGGGPIVDLACHYFDQWRFLFDADPVRVKASGMTFSAGAPELPGVEPELDTATVLVEYDSGDVGMISVSWGLPRGTRGGGLEDLLAPHGVVTVHGLQKLTIARPGGEEVLDGLGNDMYLDQTRAFAQAVLAGAPVSTTGTDGLMALRVSLAAIESARTGEAVELADRDH